MQIFLIICLLCSIGCAMIASSKNLNVGAWFFGGLIFGIFGLIAVVIADSESQESAVRKAADAASKNPWKCPQCGFVNQPWVQNCYGIVEERGVRALCGIPKPVAEKKCPRCAEMVKTEAKVCRFCQYEFPPTSPAAKQTGKRSKSSTNLLNGAKQYGPVYRVKIHYESGSEPVLDVSKYS